MVAPHDSPIIARQVAIKTLDPPSCTILFAWLPGEKHGVEKARPSKGNPEHPVNAHRLLLPLFPRIAFFLLQNVTGMMTISIVASQITVIRVLILRWPSCYTM